MMDEHIIFERIFASKKTLHISGLYIKICSIQLRYDFIIFYSKRNQVSVILFHLNS